MATDQGKLGNVNAGAILAEARANRSAAIGTTTFRPFYYAGRIWRARWSFHLAIISSRCARRRFTTGRPSTTRSRRDRLWMRSSWFPLPHETDWLESVIREVKATRERVGICDVLTLGKIDVQGPDAGEFLTALLQRLVTLEIGKARYGLMLREDGIVFRRRHHLQARRRSFLMTTTTANAARVMSHMEFCHQALWPELDVQYVSVSEQWAQIAVAGPKARATLQKIVDGIELNDQTFPLSRRAGGFRPGRHPVPPLPHLVLGRSMPMSCRLPGTTATWPPARSCRPAKNSASRLTARGALGHAHREGSCRGRRTQRHHPPPPIWASGG